MTGVCVALKKHYLSRIFNAPADYMLTVDVAHTQFFGQSAKDCLPDGIPEEFSSWDKIVVPAESAARLAVNGLSVNEEVYVTDTAFRETVGKELEKKRDTGGVSGFSFHKSIWRFFPLPFQSAFENPH